MQRCIMRLLFSNHRQNTSHKRGLKPAQGSWGARVKARTIARRTRACMRPGEEGAALVEFALVVPMMLVVITGMFSVVIALINYQQLGNATNGAAQVLITARGILTDPCASVESAVTSTLPTWSPTKFTYTVTLTNSAGTATTYGPTTGSSFSCTAGAAVLTSGTGASGEPASVTVSYAYTWLPVFWLRWAPTKLSGNLKTSASVLVD